MTTTAGVKDEKVRTRSWHWCDPRRGQGGVAAGPWSKVSAPFLFKEGFCSCFCFFLFMTNSSQLLNPFGVPPIIYSVFDSRPRFRNADSPRAYCW